MVYLPYKNVGLLVHKGMMQMVKLCENADTIKMAHHQIEINPTTIVFRFMGRSVYTIWEDEYDEVIDAIIKSRQYKKERDALEKKFKLKVK